MSETGVVAMPQNAVAEVAAIRRSANQLSELVNRIEMANMAGLTHSGTRDQWEEFGYKRKLTNQDYIDAVLRDPIAKRANDSLPNETWRKRPRVREVDDKGRPVPESKWEPVINNLLADKKFWPAARRADILAGMGRWATIVIGSTRSRGKFDTPIDRDRITGPGDIGYFRTFLERDSEIRTWDLATDSPRFGHPQTYSIRLFGDSILQASTGFKPTSVISTSTASGTVPFHHSRVIHVADNQLADELFGRPRIEPVFNAIQDMAKVWGSASESYWRNVAGILHANVDPQVVLPDIDPETGEKPLEQLKDELIELYHSVERVLTTFGVDVNHIGGGDPDPRGAFQVLMSVVAAGMNIPKRILFGSERGELASTNDRAQYLTSVERRQAEWAEPMIIRPCINTLIRVRAVPAPSYGYMVEWPNLFELTEKEMAEIARLKATAASELSRARTGVTSPFTPEEEREVLGVPRERPDSELDNEFREEERAGSQAAAATAGEGQPNASGVA